MMPLGFSLISYTRISFHPQSLNIKGRKRLAPALPGLPDEAPWTALPRNPLSISIVSYLNMKRIWVKADFVQT
jgi:hypothetical protein